MRFFFLSQICNFSSLFSICFLFLFTFFYSITVIVLRNLIALHMIICLHIIKKCSLPCWFIYFFPWVPSLSVTPPPTIHKICLLLPTLASLRFAAPALWWRSSWGWCFNARWGLQAQMRTVNISYLYLQGDTEGSANSNRVRCMTPIHSFNYLANRRCYRRLCGWRLLT